VNLPFPTPRMGKYKRFLGSAARKRPRNEKLENRKNDCQQVSLARLSSAAVARLSSRLGGEGGLARAPVIFGGCGKLLVVGG